MILDLYCKYFVLIFDTAFVYDSFIATEASQSGEPTGGVQAQEKAASCIWIYWPHSA